MCRISIVPRFAVTVPETLAWLLAPVACTVIVPPGPGAALFNKASNWPLLVTLMATPEALPLEMLMFPPLALCR